MSHLQQVLEERAWLGGSADPCPLVRAVYWSLMVQVNPLVSLDGVAKEILQANDDVPLVSAVYGPRFVKLAVRNNNSNTGLLYSTFSIISSKRFTQYYPSKDS